jgi:hypothetical protein
MRSPDGSAAEGDELLSPEIQAILQPVGVGLEPIDLDAIVTMRSRDGLSPSSQYLYNTGLVKKYQDSADITGLRVDSTLVGYALAGTFYDEREEIGEIGKVYISHDARDLKLGSFLTFAMWQRLLTRQTPHVLVNHITDKTGKIEHLHQMLGYAPWQPLGDSELWRREITSKKDRAHLLGQVEQELGARALDIAGFGDALTEAADRTDKDNPRKVDIVQTVEERLSGARLDHKQVLFGYYGAPVFLRSLYRMSTFNGYRWSGELYSVHLNMLSSDPDGLLETLRERDDMPEPNVLVAFHNTDEIAGVSVETRTHDPAEAADHIKRLAQTAADSIGFIRA